MQSVEDQVRSEPREASLRLPAARMEALDAISYAIRLRRVDLLFMRALIRSRAIERLIQRV